MSTESTDSVGVVKSISKGIAEVEVMAGGGCSSCSMSLVCGSTKKNIKFTAKASENVKINDKVRIELITGSKVLSALIVFLLPVLFMVLGYLLGTLLGLNEGLSVLVAMGMLAVSFVPVKLIDKLYGRKISYEIVEILPKNFVVEPISCERSGE